MSPLVAFPDVTIDVESETCYNKVYGFCFVGQESTDPHTGVFFRCRVKTFDHSTQLMASLSFDMELSGFTAITTNIPRPGPTHDWHEYCREVSGNGNNESINFTPNNVLFPVMGPQTNFLKKKDCEVQEGENPQQ